MSEYRLRILHISDLHAGKRVRQCLSSPCLHTCRLDDLGEVF